MLGATCCRRPPNRDAARKAAATNKKHIDMNTAQILEI
jgi:hypothetical protein